MFIKCLPFECLSIKCLSIRCVFTKCQSIKCLSPKSHWAFSWRKFKVCGWMLKMVKYGEKTNSSQNKSLRCIYTCEVRCTKPLPTAITAVLALAFLGEMETMERQVFKMSIDYRGHHWNVATQPTHGRQAVPMSTLSQSCFNKVGHLLVCKQSKGEPQIFYSYFVMS